MSVSLGRDVRGGSLPSARTWSRKTLRVAGEVVRVLPADADVQHRALAHEPRVAAQVALEEELRHLARHAARARGCVVELELDLLRGDHAGRSLARRRRELRARPGRSGRRRRRRARARRCAVREPAIALARQRAQRLAEAAASRRSARSEEVVELAAADAVAHDLGIGDARGSAAERCSPRSRGTAAARGSSRSPRGRARARPRSAA